MALYSKQDIIQKLNMTLHEEGGYFAEVYRNTVTMATKRAGTDRSICTSIYYMLTDTRPIGIFHRNRSNIVHYFHLGSALTYYIIYPSDGRLEVVTLGPDLDRGQVLQMVIPGGCWKATELEEGEFGLLGEAVVPGFDCRDRDMAECEELVREFPQHEAIIRKFCEGGDGQK